MTLLSLGVNNVPKMGKRPWRINSNLLPPKLAKSRKAKEPRQTAEMLLSPVESAIHIPARILLRIFITKPKMLCHTSIVRFQAMKKPRKTPKMEAFGKTSISFSKFAPGDVSFDLFYGIERKLFPGPERNLTLSNKR